MSAPESGATAPNVLMAEQIERELGFGVGRELGFGAWITDRDPPDVPRSYLCSMLDGDGNTHVAVHYWYRGWGSVGPFARVLGWQWSPDPIKP